MGLRTASVVLALFSLLAALLASPAEGAALTTRIDSHEKACYYAWVDQVGEKVGFYYAVQSGGDFRVAYSVHDPNDNSILEEPSARQLDVIFTGNQVGEYVFCFYNGPDDKMVRTPPLLSPFFCLAKWTNHALNTPADIRRHQIDFDITVESEPRLELPISEGHVVADHTAPLEESLSTLWSELTAIERTQRFFRTRENRNYDTVKNTQYAAHAPPAGPARLAG